MVFYDEYFSDESNLKTSKVSRNATVYVAAETESKTRFGWFAEALSHSVAAFKERSAGRQTSQQQGLAAVDASRSSSSVPDDSIDPRKIIEPGSNPKLVAEIKRGLYAGSTPVPIRAYGKDVPGASHDGSVDGVGCCFKNQGSI